MWLLSAAGMIALALLAVAPLIRLARRIASYLERALARRTPSRKNLQEFFALLQSGVLRESLTRRLVILSAARFVVVVLMAGSTAAAIGTSIPLWQLAAATPFVYLATVIAATPGGIGVNELTYTGVLRIFGTPLSVAAPWTLANRVLCVVSCFLVAAFAATLMGASRFASAGAARRRQPLGSGSPETCGAPPERQIEESGGTELR